MITHDKKWTHDYCMELDMEIFASYIGALLDQQDIDQEHINKNKDTEKEEAQKQVLRDRLPK